MQCLESGLRPDLVMPLSVAACSQKCSQMFQYVERPTPNPNRTMKPFRTCNERNRGLCDTDVLANSCSVGTYNLWKVCRRHYPPGQIPTPLLVLLGVPRAAVQQQLFLIGIPVLHDLLLRN